MGQEQVFINAERDMDWRVENDQREFTGNNRDLTVKANQAELIEAAKHEHVKGEHATRPLLPLPNAPSPLAPVEISLINTTDLAQQIANAQ